MTFNELRERLQQIRQSCVLLLDRAQKAPDFKKAEAAGVADFAIENIDAILDDNEHISFEIVFDPARRDQLLQKLQELGEPGDPEIAHGMADDALLEFINDPEITAAFERIEKWYA